MISANTPPSRSFLPLSKAWNIRVPAPYSRLVRDGDHAWTAGHLALDAKGEALAPFDAMAQGDIVAGYIEATLADAAIAPGKVSRLVLYCSEHDEAKRSALRGFFARRFGHGPLIEMVSVPHFYYPGVLLAVDAFVAPATETHEEELPDGGLLRFIREENIEQLNIAAPADQVGPVLGAAMSRHKLSPDRLLSGWGVAPEPALATIPAQVAPRLPGFFSGALMPCFLGDNMVRLYLSFGVGPVELMERRGRKVRLHLARVGSTAYLDGRYLGSGASAGLAEQTEAVMEGLKQMMAEIGLSFGDVVKSTTFYAGGDQPEALHENLEVRNRYYSSPGPASTAVPIARMADIGSKVRVELVLKPT